MRSRTLKPGFFTNEALAEVSPFARLLFMGLWCLADKDGVLEDRPKRIKAAVFPYDPIEDVNTLLDDLKRVGLIVRYVAKEVRLIWIRNFSKHQRPHPKELSLNYPLPTDELCESRESSRQSREQTGESREKVNQGQPARTPLKRSSCSPSPISSSYDLINSANESSTKPIEPPGSPPSSANFKNQSGATTMLQDRRTQLRRKTDRELGDLKNFLGFPDFVKAFYAACNRWRKMFPGTDPLVVARLAHAHAIKKSITVRKPIGFIEEFYAQHFRFKTEERIRMSAIDRFADAKLKERESIGRGGTYRSADGSHGLVEVGSVLRNMMGDIGKN